MSAVAWPRSATLLPGDVVLGERGDQLETLLGSCVSIILTDPSRTVGVMSHIVVTDSVSRGALRDATLGAQALREMFQQLQRRGFVPALCEAYVFGGGNMFPHMLCGPQIGDDNADWALRTLEDMGVRIVGSDVGGTFCRKLSWTVGPDAPRVRAIPIQEPGP
jgi:chemotaxis protein CheD